MRRTSHARWGQQEGLARDFRKVPTPSEALLWERLRGRRAGGLKFRRQHPIGRFIVDFYCVEAGLVVEVDGPVHEEARADDERREHELRERNVRVLRVTNADIACDLDAVVAKVIAAAQQLA